LCFSHVAQNVTLAISPRIVILLQQTIECWYLLPVRLLNTQYGDTALVHAAKHGRTDCVRLLLEVGANKEAMSIVRDFIFTSVYVTEYV
jgi:hypothetical protein